MFILLDGVPHSGILFHFFFKNIYRQFIVPEPRPQISQNTIITDYIDDKAIISIDNNPLTVSGYVTVYTHLNLMSEYSEWYTKWHIKPNSYKLVHRYNCHSTALKSPIPTTDTIRHLLGLVERVLRFSTQTYFVLNDTCEEITLFTRSTQMYLLIVKDYLLTIKTRFYTLTIYSTLGWS